MNQKQYVRKKHIKKNILVIISVIIFVIALLGIYIIIYNYDRVSYEDYDLYVYIANIRRDLKGTVTVSKKKGITSLESDNEKYIITSNPLYFTKHKNWAMIPDDMLYVDLKNSKYFYKMKHYTIIKSDGTSVYVTVGNEDRIIDPSILYDGNDLYVFPYDTTVNVDGTEYKLKGLSYILVNYHSSVEIFNKENDSYIYLDTHQKDVIAETFSYKVNLDTDTVFDDNNSRLLIKDLENVKEYK